MSKAQHTPGPWKATLRKTVTHIGSNTKKIATMGSARIGLSPEDEANARLIAASPELLAALEAAKRELTAHGITIDKCGDGDFDGGPTKDVLMMIDAAIAKAKGE